MSKCICGKVMERAEDVNEEDTTTCTCKLTYIKQDGIWQLKVEKPIQVPKPIEYIRCDCGKDYSSERIGVLFRCKCSRVYTLFEGKWVWILPPDTSQTDPTEGRKFSKGKQRWDLVPMGTFRQIVRVLTFGAGKYAPENWKYVKDARQEYYAAAKRHIEDWWEGGTNDKETGIHLLAHACCCLLFLMWFDLTNQKKKELAREITRKEGLLDE